MSCDCDSYQTKLMPFNEALTRLMAAAKPTIREECITLKNALTRVLSDDIFAPINVPAYDNSAMDGYALNAEDLINTNQLKLVGAAFAGRPYEGQINQGECIRIMTGAKMPIDADTVVMQEQTSVQNDQVLFQAEVKQSQNVRRAGEDITQGEVVLSKSTSLGVADIGLLASLGIHEIKVLRKPTIALISTGDELVEPGSPLYDGQIYESNRYTLLAALQSLPVNVIDFGIIKDDQNLLREALQSADAQADIVISSGGVSVGEADFVKDILVQLGHVAFCKLAIKPGKPFAFGQLANSFFIGLPGNPVSAAVTFEQLALPFIKKCMALNQSPKVEVIAIAESNFKKRPGRYEFQRGVATQKNGEWSVKSTGQQGSGILSSLGKANCYVLLDEKSSGVTAGQIVKIQLFELY